MKPPLRSGSARSRVEPLVELRRLTFGEDSQGRAQLVALTQMDGHILQIVPASERLA